MKEEELFLGLLEKNIAYPVSTVQPRIEYCSPAALNTGKTVLVPTELLTTIYRKFAVRPISPIKVYVYRSPTLVLKVMTYLLLLGTPTI